MARYDDSQPYTPDYEDDCADCEGEFPRGELAWFGGQYGTDRLICADCEDKALARLSAKEEHNARKET